MSLLNQLKTIEKFKSDQQTNYLVDFKRINMTLEILSWIGHAACVFLAYFFLSNLLLVKISNVLVVGVISTILLVFFELLKRDVLHKWAKSFINSKFTFLKKSPLVLFTFGVLIMIASFAATFTGVSKFTNKEDEIAVQAEDKTFALEDSLSIKWENRIEPYRVELKNMESKREEYETKLSSINKKYLKAKEEEKTILSAEKNNVEQNNETIKAEIVMKRQELKKLEDKSKEEIGKQLSRVEKQKNKDLSTNTESYLAFIILGIFLEVIILIGVYFGQYYRWKSAKDWDDLVNRDERVRKYLKYRSIIGTLIQLMDNKPVSETPITAARQLGDFLKMKGHYITDKEVNEFFSYLDSLKLIENKSGRRYFTRSTDDCMEIFEKSFNS